MENAMEEEWIKDSKATTDRMYIETKNGFGRISQYKHDSELDGQYFWAAMQNGNSMSGIVLNLKTAKDEVIKALKLTAKEFLSIVITEQIDIITKHRWEISATHNQAEGGQPDGNLSCPFCGGHTLYPANWVVDDEEVEAIECNNCHAGAPTNVWNKTTKQNSTEGKAA